MTSGEAILGGVCVCLDNDDDDDDESVQRCVGSPEVARFRYAIRQCVLQRRSPDLCAGPFFASNVHHGG